MSTSATPTPLHAAARLALLLGAELGALATLHALGSQPWARVTWGDLAGWMVATPPDAVVAATCRLLGLTVGSWLLGATVLTTAAHLGRSRSLHRVAAAVTPTALRRTVERALVATALGAVLATAGAPASPALAQRPVSGSAEATTPGPPGLTPPSAEDRPGPATPPVPSPVPSPASPVPSPSPRPATSADRVERRHTVAPGEHLWGIARATLEADGPVDVGEVAAYWLRVIAVNRDHLRSGDPDLIHPGEEILLPPAGDAG